MDANNNAILTKNKNSWDAMADLWFGTTALPEYGCFGRLTKITYYKERNA